MHKIAAILSILFGFAAYECLRIGNIPLMILYGTCYLASTVTFFRTGESDE